MENPKLALIPSGYKSGKVYSILPTDGVGDFDFSRGSTATRVNKDGLIETVNNNVPRLDWLNSDCPSLLLEPQRTNLQVRSEEFDNSSWGKLNSIIDANSIVSPNGELTADKFIANTTTGTHYIQSTVSSLSTSSEATFSIFVKKSEISQLQLLCAQNSSPFTNWARLNFDLNSLTAFSSTVGTFGYKDYGNGWLRVFVTGTPTGSGALIRVSLFKNFGDYFAGNNSDGLYVFGAQVEQGNYPTSYIKTTVGIETRLKDFIDGAGSSSLFNSLESTFFVEMASFLNAQTNSNGIELSDISGQNRITLQYDPTNNQIRCDVRVLNSAQAIITTSGFDITNFNKMAITYKLNEVKFYVNGQLISTDTIVNLFAPNTLTEVRSTIAGISGGAFNLQAKIKDLRVYDRVLTEAESIELTTI